ncbi:lipopolysaccharide biosynthesis protein [Halorarius litoreus]|uniref:lipopolysaccharide biosynthesis protein n=1 Tax=Halorarius litoreus TaxID=2962676 RepID=UPI0020CEC2FD|nr:hypothetical protein [Halorarius litoreus]
MIQYLSVNALLILSLNSLYHLDIILLRVFVGNPQTGVYKAALVIAEFLWFVPNTVRTVFLHSMSELWAEENVDRISELSSLATRYTLLLTILLAIGIATLGDAFIPLYFGPGFERSALPLLILLPGVIGFAAIRPVIAVGQGKGRLRILLLATFGSSMLNLVLNLALIPS